LRPAENRRNATTVATPGKSCRRNTLANAPTGVARQDKAQIATLREELAQAREADLRQRKVFADFQRDFMANQQKFKEQVKSTISKKNKAIEALRKKVQAAEERGAALLAENEALERASRTKEEQISSLEEETTVSRPCCPLFAVFHMVSLTSFSFCAVFGCKRSSLPENGTSHIANSQEKM
jgi:hypothetical protein